MRIDSITYGLVRISLITEECQHLARACDEALDNIVSIEDGALRTYIETAGTVFEVAAMVGAAQMGGEA